MIIARMAMIMGIYGHYHCHYGYYLPLLFAINGHYYLPFIAITIAIMAIIIPFIIAIYGHYYGHSGH